MSRQKESTTVYFDTETIGRLRLLTKHSKVPTAVFVREAVKALLPDWEEQVARGEQIEWGDGARAGVLPVRGGGE